MLDSPLNPSPSPILTFCSHWGLPRPPRIQSFYGGAGSPTSLEPALGDWSATSFAQTQRAGSSKALGAGCCSSPSTKLGGELEDEIPLPGPGGRLSRSPQEVRDPGAPPEGSGTGAWLPLSPRRRPIIALALGVL